MTGLVPSGTAPTFEVEMKEEDHRDLEAIIDVMKEHNGVTVIVEDPAQAEQVTAWDACPWGLGRVSSDTWYGIPMPVCLQGLPIHAQEMANMTAYLTFQVEVEGL